MRGFLVSSILVAAAGGVALGAEDGSGVEAGDAMRRLGGGRVGEIVRVQRAGTTTIRLDDGTFEDGISFGNGTSSDLGEIAQRFDLPGPGTIRGVESCWTRLASESSFKAVGVTLYQVAAGGGPGTLFANQAEAVGPIPVFPQFLCQTIQVTASAPASGRVFAGISVFGGSDHFLGMDQSGGTSRAAIVGRVNFGAWTSGSFADVRAAGIRLEFDPSGGGGGGGGGGGSCTPSSTTVCLNDGRFAVSADFTTLEGERRTGRAESFSNDTGYFWFLDPDNIESTVKVLDACPINGAFWVFAGGMTNLEVEIRVLDTATSRLRTYTNPRGVNFQTVADTGAFLTCP